MPRRSLPTRLRAALKRAADPEKAAPMRAYMKSAMPYLGVATPERKAVLREVFEGLDYPSAEAWRREVLAIWRGARWREERYGAIALTGVRHFDRFQDMKALPMYEEMITTGAWWDYVDELAAHRLGPLLRRFPGPMKRRMRSWARGRDLWKRRSAILCQLTFKGETDLDLLYGCIEPSLDSREFFLRKAVGWALRQYAWTDPSEVQRYVRQNDNRLSPLSAREALKNVGPAAARSAGTRRPGTRR